MTDETETERQQTAESRWEKVRAEIWDAWCEQQTDMTRIQWGLIWKFVEAVRRKAAWARYRAERGEWLLRSTSYEELRIWRSLAEGDRGPEPGPPKPDFPEPDDRDLPVLTPDRYGEKHGPESDARIYLAACRIRAGLEVDPRYVETARSRYPWARHAAQGVAP